MSQIDIKPFFAMVAEFNENLPSDSVLDVTLRQKLIREEWTETKAELKNKDVPKSVLIKEICDLIYVATGGVNALGYGHFIVSLPTTVVKSQIATEKSIDKGVESFSSSPDIMHLFKVLINSIYLALKFVTYDELLQAFTLVHQSNMEKFKNPKFDKTGKLQKGKSKKPNLSFLDITETSESNDGQID